MSFQNIVLAGATGFLGQEVLFHLLTIPSINKLTMLTRTNTKHEFPNSPILSIARIASYEDHSVLVTLIQGHDLVISTVGGLAAQTIDALLLTAAISAGVQRLMPSEYTLDVMHPHAIEVAGSTVLAGKIRDARDLETLATEGVIEYTTLVTGGILDWWFENGDLGIDIKGKKGTLHDGGEKWVSGSTACFIAECVGAVVSMPKETRNRRIRVAEVRYSGREVLQTFEEVTGEKWEVEEKSTDLLLAEGKKAGTMGDIRGFYLGNILKLNFDGEGAGFFEEGLDFASESIKRKNLKEIVESSIRSK